VTRRRQASRVLVRALVVLGGGFVLLLLGAATAGATTEGSAARDRLPAPVIPSPAPVALAVPVPAPIRPVVPARDIATGGLSVTVAPSGIGVALDPALPALPGLSDVPTLPPVDAVVTPPTDDARPAPAIPATVASRRSVMRRPTAASLDTTSAAAMPLLPQPRPPTPSDAPLSLAIAALALAGSPILRDGAGAEHVVIGDATPILSLPWLEAVPRARAAALAGGFRLPPARPG
jgi:hypothetical protein